MLILISPFLASRGCSTATGMEALRLQSQAGWNCVETEAELRAWQGGWGNSGAVVFPSGLLGDLWRFIADQLQIDEGTPTKKRPKPSAQPGVKC